MILSMDGWTNHEAIVINERAALQLYLSTPNLTALSV